jgi:uncharacterized damage-inducible protein DinB
MEADLLKGLYEVNHYAIKANLESLSHEQSFVSPDAGGNCIHWVLGHILCQRRAILTMLGEEPVWSEEQAARYRRGSEPVTERTNAPRLETMVGDLDRTQERLMSGLARLSVAGLPVGEEGAGLVQKLSMLQFHEAYHAGQIGLLRRVAGAPGAIR